MILTSKLTRGDGHLNQAAGAQVNLPEAWAGLRGPFPRGWLSRSWAQTLRALERGGGECPGDGHADSELSVKRGREPGEDGSFSMWVEGTGACAVRLAQSRFKHAECQCAVGMTL